MRYNGKLFRTKSTVNRNLMPNADLNELLKNEAERLMDTYHLETRKATDGPTRVLERFSAGF